MVGFVVFYGIVGKVVGDGLVVGGFGYGVWGIVFVLVVFVFVVVGGGGDGDVIIIRVGEVNEWVIGVDYGIIGEVG